MWCEHRKFKTMVVRSWLASCNLMGIPKLVTKLKRLRHDLKSWNWKVFGRMDLIYKSWKTKLISSKSKILRNILCYLLLIWSLEKAERRILLWCENIMCKQNSRLFWHLEGDSISHFFHASVNYIKKKLLNSLTLLYG